MRKVDDGKRKKKKKKKEKKRMAFLVATTSLPAVYRPNDDRWNAARSCQKSKEQLQRQQKWPLAKIFCNSCLGNVQY